MLFRSPVDRGRVDMSIEQSGGSDRVESSRHLFPGDACRLFFRIQNRLLDLAEAADAKTVSPFCTRGLHALAFPGSSCLASVDWVALPRTAVCARDVFCNANAHHASAVATISVLEASPAVFPRRTARELHQIARKRLALGSLTPGGQH